MTKREVTKEINAALKEVQAAINKALAKAQKKINKVCVKSGFSYNNGTPKHAAEYIVDIFANEHTWYPGDLFNEEREARKLATLKKANEELKDEELEDEELDKAMDKCRDYNF